MRLKFRIEDYIRTDGYDPAYTFGYFLEQYLQLTQRKKKEFAHDIQIHETLLSQILNDRREPTESIFIRLELHSGNTISAINWLKLAEKKKKHQIKTDHSLRERERQYVNNRLSISCRDWGAGLSYGRS
ncbi:hypothetical protein FW774_18640 [Pedobacter sp. BS3]|uniref:hypothetical protein n=1 Tax=Pedobacter sp. BS3 TaxID=2567937 RepID=UPI0011EE747E|nr:hypothetical protein [Pedobacter sp. BS3]TZF81292.1 hypothetical protein FW774_18640 [Pedobacter sp. BS3]